MPLQLLRPMSNEKAFTLIEVIVSLVLLGILAVIAGMGLVQITQGYVFAQKNAETVQKAQVAVARIVKELGAAEKQTTSATAITAIVPSPTTSVTYTRQEPVGSGTFITNIIDLNGTTVRVKVGDAAAATLIDNVTAFTLVYRNAAGTAITTPLVDIRGIDISMTISGANNTPINFDKNTVFIKGSY
jgi:prepilin-type N-terminal cleavage/methylation domain-containing protein